MSRYSILRKSLPFNPLIRLYQHCSVLEIRGNSELHLLHKDALESGNIIPLTEKKHSHFIINGVNRAEGEGAVTMSNENTIRTDACRSHTFALNAPHYHAQPLIEHNYVYKAMKYRNKRLSFSSMSGVGVPKE